jgi:hypothetical protein
MELCLPSLLAESELRERAIRAPLSSDRAYDLIFELTQDPVLADQQAAEVALANAWNKQAHEPN